MAFMKEEFLHKKIHKKEDFFSDLTTKFLRMGDVACVKQYGVL